MNDNNVENNNVENFDINEKENNYGHNLDPEVKAKLDQKNNTDEYLIRKFMGTSANKILGSTLNIGAFFFGALYFFYRKMYIYGVLVIGINLLLTLLPFKYASIILNIFLLLFTNKIYTDFAYGQVQSLKRINSDMDKDKLSIECAKRGGTSFIAALIAFVALAAIISATGIFDISSVDVNSIIKK